MNAISIANLTKRYGTTLAVDDVSFEIGDGSVCGLLGPNGAGKSTTMRCLLGLIRPTSGRLAIAGAPVVAETFESLAYVPDSNALYCWMTIADHIEITRRSYKNFDRLRLNELIAMFALDPRKKVGALSKGQQTAVALALAFSIRPRVLVLDEPSSGLDPIFQRVVLDLIIDAASNGATVLFSSHQIGQVERAADRVVIMRSGKTVVDGEIDRLKSDEKIVEAIFPTDAYATAQFDADARIRRVERMGRTLRLFVRTDAEAVARDVETLAPRAVQILDLGLEDIFLGAVGADAITQGMS